ncbi:uncharacterized protein LOC111705273 [Eurytemora carolleeae]|uniref:uncharacterized protein LOC111705273 n=1 Tax=Eurytemora carolleeae TaxID=1294199 RepID=UPI000C770D71|nr:uncharacterized protein LOC111705273 [Eurytemora carolleeae]|eukprot:XP_023333548.1 uncharacterized protein LOC111705273 [Eurytemora affinis]
MEFKKWAVQPTSEPGSARSNLNSSRSRVVSRLMTTRDQEMTGSKEKLSESFSMSHESSLQQEPISFSEEKNLASSVGASQYSDGRVDTKNSRWLVPQPEIQEDEVKKNFDPDTVNSSVVPSPLRPIKVYLRIGLLVGAFPADVGERYIHYFFEFCDGRTWYVMLVLLLWMLGGVGLIVYCLISSTTSTFISIFQSKTTWTWMSMTSTDQLVLLSIPVVSLIFIPLLIGMSWSRINSLSEICENFVTNGYRVGFTPSNRTMSALAYR